MDYRQHDTKPMDLFEIKGGQKKSIYEKICAKMKREKIENLDSFSEYDFYIYLQPTDAGKRGETSFFSRSTSTQSYKETSTSNMSHQTKASTSTSRQWETSETEGRMTRSVKRKLSSSAVINSPSSTSLEM